MTLKRLQMLSQMADAVKSRLSSDDYLCSIMSSWFHKSNQDLDLKGG